MKISAISVGLPQEHVWKNKKVLTSIFKRQVPGPVAIHVDHIEGDGSADLRFHGGPFRAVYSYSGSHYPYWYQLLGKNSDQLTLGSFGENLTVEAMDETVIEVGDQYEVGTTILEATQPRWPCTKLELRLNDDTIIKRFLNSGRFGIYWRVEKTGNAKVGDPVRFIKPGKTGIKINDIVAFLSNPKAHALEIKKLLSVQNICPDLRKKMSSLVSA